MKGIVFNLLEQLVARDYGEDTWDALLDAGGLGGAYTSLGSYPDEDLTKLVSAASGALEMSVDDVVFWFGRGALPLFAGRNPQLFEPHASAQGTGVSLRAPRAPERHRVADQFRNSKSHTGATVRRQLVGWPFGQ